MKRREKLYEEEYTQADVLSTIDSLKGTQVQAEDKPVGNDSLRDAALEYIKDLEGFRIRLREIHWQTESDAEHRLTDKLIETFESHEDEVAEIVMGLLGVRIKVGEVVPNLPKEQDLTSMLQQALNSVVHLKSKIIQAPGYSGLDSLLDDFSNTISKGNFLRTLK